jgi:hypothetical protein
MVTRARCHTNAARDAGLCLAGVGGATATDGDDEARWRSRHKQPGAENQMNVFKINLIKTGNFGFLVPTALFYACGADNQSHRALLLSSPSARQLFDMFPVLSVTVLTHTPSVLFCDLFFVFTQV